MPKATGLYMICTISKHAAEKEGYTDAHDARLPGLPGGKSTGSNVFFVADGVIHTPLARLLPETASLASR